MDSPQDMAFCQSTGNGSSTMHAEVASRHGVWQSPASTDMHAASGTPRQVFRPLTTRGSPAVPVFAVHVDEASNPAKRVRKDWGSNWQAAEIVALIYAKRLLHAGEIDNVDSRDLMNTNCTKWMRVSMLVMKAGMSPCHRDPAACKSKWNQILPEYKRVADYLARTGINGPEYWSLSAIERKSEGLPRSFLEEVFYGIHEWFGERPTMQPPHARDLQSKEDNIYQPPSVNIMDSEDTKVDTEDTMNSAFNMPEGSNPNFSAFMPSQPRHHASLDSALPRHMNTAQNRRFSNLPAGVVPQVISSSDTNDQVVPCRIGNIGIQRKNLSGHTVIAEATKASGNVMVHQMKEIADASRDLEKAKIDVHLQIFLRQMEYQKDRDTRLHENAMLANENAELAIMKQGEVVQCLSNLSTVLSAGMKRTTSNIAKGEHHYSPQRTVQLGVGQGSGLGNEAVISVEPALGCEKDKSPST